LEGETRLATIFTELDGHRGYWFHRLEAACWHARHLTFSEHLIIDLGRFIERIEERYRSRVDNEIDFIDVLELRPSKANTRLTRLHNITDSNLKQEPNDMTLS
jgi:hypothetical protein